MTEPGFEIIFEDVIEADEGSLHFLGLMEGLIPGAGLLLIQEGGKVLKSGWQVNLSHRQHDEFVGLVREKGHLFSRLPEDNQVCYGTLLPGLDAVLLICGIGEVETEKQLVETRNLLDNTIELALLKQQHEILVVEKQQARKQINILKKQHDRLIEDNYRQYRLNQEREKEYARKLETEIARQTAELREANSRLKEISRLKSDFLANMSHELRTPMNAIIGFTDLLTETRLDSRQRDYAGTIKQSARSLLALINDILDLARVESGKLQLEHSPFDLRQLINDIVDMFRIQAVEKGLEIGCTVDHDLPETVAGDPDRLRQVLVNLVGNAIKFTEKGSVSIRVAVEKDRGEGKLVSFRVADSGIGIAADRIHAIFDNFTQADGSTTREYGGTGLGLAICQQLVDLMEGNIYVSSEPGRGSVFCFIVPLEQALAEEAPVAAMGDEIRPEARTAGQRILIVEDNAVNQRLAGILVERLGYEFEVAADGLQALEKLKKQVFDLVLMDVQMPRMDGREATKRIRAIESDPEQRRQCSSFAKRDAPLQIIGLTAHARTEDEQSCYESGMNAFLAKPLVKEKLDHLLNKLGSRAKQR